MKLLLSLSFLILSTLCLAQEGSKQIYINGMNKLVADLNEIFQEDIRIKRVSDDCGFSMIPEDQTKFITYCSKDLEYFLDLEDEKDIYEGVLTIIAHEYAHALLDYGVSDEADQQAMDIMDDAVSCLEDGLSDSTSDVRKIESFFKEIYGVMEDIPEEELLSENLYSMLFTLEHFNTDSLSTKLMLMTNRVPNPKILWHLPGASGAIMTESYKKLINDRINFINVSIDEGLDSWSNYVCVNPGYSDDESNLSIKSVLKRRGYDKILESLNKKCSRSDLESNVNDYVETI